MKISEHVTVYLKTTETCQLNCKHCYTSGSNGKKIFFQPKKVIKFFEELHKAYPHIKSVNFGFHGGEPMLAPLELLYEAYHGLKDIFEETRFSMQTNLVYNLTPEYKKFFKDILYDNGFGTSWDYDLRFANKKQLDLWESNTKELLADGHMMTMLVSISKQLILNMEPSEVIEYAADLGFQYILFERITGDGNALINEEIMPSNKDQDDWLSRMFNQTIENKTYERIGNMFLDEAVQAYLYRSHVGNRCRKCEQSMLTINADGTIAGCPNSAPSENWGHIEWSIKDSIESRKRNSIISCEIARNPICYSCPAYKICNGDCHQLSWEDGLCAAPKSIFKQMIQDADTDTYKKLLL